MITSDKQLVEKIDRLIDDNLVNQGIEAGRDLFDQSFAFQLGIAYYWLCRADYNQAAAYFQKMQVLNPDDKGQIPILLYCEAKRGNRQKADLTTNERLSMLV